MRLGRVPECRAQSADTVRGASQRTGHERQLQRPAGRVHLQRSDVGLQRGLPVGRGRTQAARAAGGFGKVAKVVRGQTVQSELGQRFRIERDCGRLSGGGQ